VAVALRSMAPGMRVLGAEPRLADDAIRSRAAGRRLPPLPPLTLAEGLRTGLGEHTWPLIRDLVHDVLPVEEEELMPVVRLLLEEAHLVVEPSGAIGLALALSGRLPPGLERVGVVLSGGNIEPRLLLQA
jgi:threonine dehydratase/serine racemase